ncbi:hypothetical protein B0H34DRAFT_143634 [Crassisporium funariophilum]|nr:hypothetical protein B0H34DRAFT_143634 [Crassisporium funariophilum]
MLPHFARVTCIYSDLCVGLFGVIQICTTRNHCGRISRKLASMSIKVFDQHLYSPGLASRIGVHLIAFSSFSMFLSWLKLEVHNYVDLLWYLDQQPPDKRSSEGNETDEKRPPLLCEPELRKSEDPASLAQSRFELFA